MGHLCPTPPPSVRFSRFSVLALWESHLRLSVLPGFGDRVSMRWVLIQWKIDVSSFNSMLALLQGRMGGLEFFMKDLLLARVVS